MLAYMLIVTISGYPTVVPLTPAGGGTASCNGDCLLAR